MPSNPRSSAYFAYGTSGIHWVPGYFGSPVRTRCSHVTWFRSWLLNTHHTRVGFSHRSQYRLTVISSFMPFIWKAPSPMNAITAFSGCANFAAIEYGAAGPIVASVPESEDRIPARSFTWRAHQFVEDPESAV